MAIRILINLARFAVTFLVATIVVFLFMRLIPGDPAQIALGVNATPELLEQTREEFGTNRPLFVQYFEWVGGIFRGDFGTSYVTRTDISPLVTDRLQVSLILVLSAMVVALLIAIPLGTWAAVKHRNFSGVVIGVGSQLGVAIPGFLAGILLVMVFAVGLGWLPANGWTAPSENFGDFIRRLILPVVALASVQGAILTRYVRSAVLEVMSEDYLRTARAKGLSKSGALVKHGLRNAAIPVITVTGVQIAALIIGAVVIERVFVIPGLGSMLLDAVGNRDLLTVQSVVIVLVAITLILNLIVDLLYTIVDPRLRRSA
ncbi:peptide/nickel transport system permease protein [Leucobacter exalbidus]|uniref:Peptide/nickel transport system permease protein n=1 Tax=Leucobacter exalbidus TaxID=662960 RepID=A0A940PQL5_9MICO|nr:ABC transporter permease [Leucobacter exalbidus]MBP1325789.1 peptide/nickel transport system permease protein [Leucobacter exalbidus]